MTNTEFEPDKVDDESRPSRGHHEEEQNAAEKKLLIEIKHRRIERRDVLQCKPDVQHRQWLIGILRGIVGVVSSFQLLHASPSKPESSHMMGHLVVEAIDTVLHQTRYCDNKDGDVVLNWRQCCQLAHELSKMKDWLLLELQILQTVSGATLAFQHLLRVVKKADVLVQECYNREFNWLRVAVLQAGNEEAFIAILHDLNLCKHNLEVLSGKIQSVGNIENVNWFEKDHVLGRRAILDKKELLENLRGYKYCNSNFQKHKDIAMQEYLLKRYSEQASEQDVEEDLPVLQWDAQGDNALRLKKDLGDGTSGQVHKSTWLGLGCAVKTFKATGNTEFRKEAGTMEIFKHPNITKLLCCTMDPKALVMELMDTDLHKWIDERMLDPNHGVPVSLPVAVDIMLQMARGLKYMHHLHVAHCDIKSSNILVTPTPVPELADMGYVDVKLGDFGQATKLMTSTTTMRPNIGTTQYRAPELFGDPHNQYTQDEERISKQVDPFKADVYSYGITCAELLTGKRPYPETEFLMTNLLWRILEGVRPPLPEDCPNDLKNLIKRCWDTNPCNRPSMSQVCDELMAFKTSSLIM